jgi:putative photosynthetic complex assembly protein 2
MSLYGLPVLYTLFVWWFSTGAILYLDGLPKRTYRWSMAAASVALAGAIYGLVRTSGDTTVAGAYISFTCGVIVWGWQEMSFLMGFLTGPRRAPCPADAGPWQRFSFATQTMLYHELGLLGSAAAVAAASWGGQNQVGMWTFMVLWVMRQSAKLNLFLGVRNLNEEFLPPHVRYLQTYFTRKPMNLLFPVSVTAATVVAALLWRRLLAPDTGAFEATGLTFVGMLLTLAILEHWFLVLPIPAEALWKWGLRSRDPVAAEHDGAPELHLVPARPVAEVESGTAVRAKPIPRKGGRRLLARKAWPRR